MQVNFVPAGSLVETVRSLLSRDCRAAAAAAAEPGQSAPGGNQCATRGQVTADSANLVTGVNDLSVRSPV